MYILNFSIFNIKLRYCYFLTVYIYFLFTHVLLSNKATGPYNLFCSLNYYKNNSSILLMHFK